LATSASLSVDQYRDGGLISIDVDALPAVALDKIEAAVWDELGRVVREPVSARELQRAKNQLLADWVTGVNTTDATANVLGYTDALGGYEYLSNYLSRAEKTTAADLQRVAAMYLRRDRATTGRLLPAMTGSTNGLLDSPFPSGEGGWRGRPADRYAAAQSEPSPLSVAFRRTPDFRGGITRGPHPQPLSRGERGAGGTAGDDLFKPLKPFERTLPNGMRLVLLENHDVPSVTLSARVVGGSFAEDPSRAGLASLLTDLLDQGTANKSPDEVSEGLEHVGAYFDSGADGLSTTSTLRCLSRHAVGLLPLFAEMLRSPSFPEEQLEKERSRVLTSLKEEDEDATAVAVKAFSALVYGEHPAGRNVEGEPATVRAITRQDLLDFHSKWFQPQNTIMVAVGDFKAAAFAMSLESAFGDWGRGPIAPKLSLPPLQRQTDRRTRRIPMDRDQMQILLGHLGIRRIDPDYLPLQVMDSILGQSAGFTARIPYQLRDIQGLAYTVEASITSSAGTEPGLFRAYIGTEAKNEQPAVAGLLAEIRRIRNEPVTATELQEARDFLANNYVFGFETQDQLAGYLQAVIRYGFGYDYRRKYVQQVRQVTAQQVLAAAKKHLDPIHYSLVVVGKTQSTGKDVK
jgi:zinc protease